MGKRERLKPRSMPHSFGPWQDCCVCSQTLNVSSLLQSEHDASIKMLAKSEPIALCTSHGFHLRCDPHSLTGAVDLARIHASGAPGLRFEEEIDVSKCPICLSSFLDDESLTLVQLPCRHFCCARCLCALHRRVDSRKECPLCRAQLAPIHTAPKALQQCTAPMEPLLPLRSSSMACVTSAVTASPSLTGTSRTRASDRRHRFDVNVGNFARGRPFQSQHMTAAMRIAAHGSVLVNCATQKMSATLFQRQCYYNDLVVCVFRRTSDGSYAHEWLNYAALKYDDGTLRVLHSGDKQSTPSDGHCRLLHNALITGESLRFEVRPLDEPCSYSRHINSRVNANSDEKPGLPSPARAYNGADTRRDVEAAFRAVLRRECLEQVTRPHPDYVVLCAQAVFFQEDAQLTTPAATQLRHFSHDVQPACAICTEREGLPVTHTVAGENDDAPLTFWALVTGVVDPHRGT